MITSDLFATDRNQVPQSVRDDVARGALIFCSHSSGKDSQVMYLALREWVPADQLIVVHANLGEEAEWPGVIEHIHDTIDSPLHVVKADRSFLDMVLRRQMFPSAQSRLCTATLKTGPIRKFIRRAMKAAGVNVAYNCTGIRAQESRARAQKSPLGLHKALCTQSRTVYDWFPIFDWNEDEVYDRIEAAGQQPHPAYGDRGSRNSRLSCRFCILGNKKDLSNSAVDDPDLYAQYVATERVTGHTMFSRSKTRAGVRESIPMSLAEKAGVPVDEDRVQRWLPVMERRLAEQAAIQAMVGRKAA